MFFFLFFQDYLPLFIVYSIFFVLVFFKKLFLSIFFNIEIVENLVL